MRIARKARLPRVASVARTTRAGGDGKGFKGGKSATVVSVARVESYPANMVTNLPGNFFVTDFLSGASGHVIVTAEMVLLRNEAWLINNESMRDT